MKRNPQSLASQRFDVLVIGAGITGAWTALDCALRGMSVALIDQSDFGAATSAKSSKLLHGGIRYLQQLKFGKVRESAMERAVLHRVAPHLSYFMPFLVPTYNSIRKGKMFMQCGMKLYDLLCAGSSFQQEDGAKRVPSSYTLSREQVCESVPINDDALTGGVVFYESHMENSERMTLAVIQSATEYGAQVANYTKVKTLYEKNGRVSGAYVEDLKSNEQFHIEANVVVNAAGPWVSELNNTLSRNTPQKLTTGFSQGSHIVTRQLVNDYAVAFPTQFQGQNVVDRGGRHIFVLPWRGHSLIGTSYTPATHLENPKITEEEIVQLTGAVNQAMPQASLSENEILHAFTGIYPLHENEIRAQVYQGTGEYLLVDHERAENRTGLVSALGAKYTTARKVAEMATNIVAQKNNMTGKRSETANKPLFAADIENLNAFRNDKKKKYENVLTEEQINRLLGQYGTEIDNIIEIDNRSLVSKERSNLKAEIIYATRSEMALHLDDVIMRRTGIGTTGVPSKDYLRACADIMANELDWSVSQVDQEVEFVEQQRFKLSSI